MVMSNIALSSLFTASPMPHVSNPVYQFFMGNGTILVSVYPVCYYTEEQKQTAAVWEVQLGRSFVLPLTLVFFWPPLERVYQIPSLLLSQERLHDRTASCALCLRSDVRHWGPWGGVCRWVHTHRRRTGWNRSNTIKTFYPLLVNGDPLSCQRGYIYGSRSFTLYRHVDEDKGHCSSLSYVPGTPSSANVDQSDCSASSLTRRGPPARTIIGSA